jgi:TATA-binding protein-associated factor Taf7
MLCLRKQQKDYEDGAMEEFDTSDEEQEEDDDDDDEEVEEEEEEDSESEHKTESGSLNEKVAKENENGSCLSSKNPKKRKQLTGKEKELLREEFVSNMYCSFLEGRDEDFDYRLVL